MRLFVAINIPESVKNHLSEIQEELKKEEAKITWVNPHNMHLTLKFLGEIDEKSTEKVKEILSKIKFGKFKLILNEIGVFPNENYITVIWVGPKEHNELFELHKMVDLSLSKFAPAERQFLGHITLGRVKFVKDKKTFAEKMHIIKVEEMTFDIDRFYLIKSELKPTGPEYEHIAEYLLE